MRKQIKLTRVAGPNELGIRLIAELVMTEKVLKKSTKADEKLIAYGAGLLAIKLADGILPENDLNVWEARFTKLLKGEEANG